MTSEQAQAVERLGLDGDTPQDEPVGGVFDVPTRKVVATFDPDDMLSRIEALEKQAEEHPTGHRATELVAVKSKTIGDATLYCGDCRELLPTIEGVDAVVTDPPYGIGYDASHKKYKNGVMRDDATWDVEPFDPAAILELDVPTILWGGNCFASRLPDHPGWLCWRKAVRNGANIRQADMELAWTNCVNRSQTFQHLWVGAYRDSENGIRNDHPTQKPIAVMAWCLSLIPDARLVIDPFMGVGTTGVACVNLGREFIGIEIDPAFFEVACERIANAWESRPRLFEPPPPPTQGDLLT